MIMTPDTANAVTHAEAIKTIAEIVEICVKIAALVLAGIWAVYGFIVFRQRQSAVTALRKTESEAAELELAARRRAVLDISLEYECRRDLDDHGYVLSAQVIIKNDGVAPAFLTFEAGSPPLMIQRVEFDEAGIISPVGPPIQFAFRRASDPSKAARSRVIRAGGTSRLPAVVSLKSAGVYAVAFRVPMDAENRKAMIEAGASETRQQYWSALSFAYVGYPPPSSGAREQPG
jgi:hypothetical protein